MKFAYIVLIGLGIFANSHMLAQGGCSTILKSIENAETDSLGFEYKRLLSYKNPYCDTTGSDFEKIMRTLEKKLVTDNVSTEDVVKQMGTPYYKGALADYENQKLTLGRDGKATGKALPPSYKIPTGEYFIVYLWRNKDYLVFALKGGKVVESRWWEKGDFR